MTPSTWKMNEIPRNDGSGQIESDGQRDTDSEYEQLRKLILAPEHAEIDEIQHRLTNPRQRIESLSQVLPDAIVHRCKRDDNLSLALAPTVVKVVDDTVRKRPKAIADALFPIIGPAIRKAIAEAFRSLTESLNRAMESNFSIQGLKWRIEARQTNRTFAEVVLAHSLVYRVEQVFLIHRKTGLLLQHLLLESAVIQDADMVSGMLTAIQDFVQDSFAPESEQALNTIHVGDLTVIIEQGPLAILAGVVRGTPKSGLREIYQLSLEEIHLNFRSSLEAFDGDTENFDATRPHLEPCLRTQLKREEKKFSPVFWLLPLLVLVLLGVWAQLQFKKNSAWNAYLERLDAEPGIVITDSDKKRGKYVISGLRDPLAADPEALREDSRLDAEYVVARWEPYQALDEIFVLKRIKRILQPPQTVQLSFDSGTLIASGNATADWRDQSQILARTIAGVEQYRTESLVIKDNGKAILAAAHKVLEPPETVELYFHNGLLTVTGSAPHGWIQLSRNKWKAIDGVFRYEDGHLVDADRQEFGRVAAQLETISVFFSEGDELAPGELTKIEFLAAKLTQLQSLAAILDKQLFVDIIGHTDSLGSDEYNLVLSLKRAESIRKLLLEAHINPGLFTVRGIAAAQPFAPLDTQIDTSKNRRVTLKIEREADVAGKGQSP